MKPKSPTPQSAAYFKANESYCFVVWNDGHKLLKAKPLKYYSAKLKAAGWCRIHRSYMVNPEFVRHISEDREYVCLQNGEELPISRRLKKKVYKWRRN